MDGFESGRTANPSAMTLPPGHSLNLVCFCHFGWMVVREYRVLVKLLLLVCKTNRVGRATKTALF
jgi:hypothetical protein